MAVSAPSLDMTFAGVKFRSPLGVGAIGDPLGKNVTPKQHADVLLGHVAAGAGYIVLPTCVYATEETIRKVRKYARPEVKPKMGRFGIRCMKAEAFTPTSPYGREGIFTLACPLWLGIEEATAKGRDVEEITKIVMGKKPKDVRVIANVGGFSDLPDSFVDAAKKWEKLGVDLIELNYSCPDSPTSINGVEQFLEKKFTSRWQGALLSFFPDICENITREVVKAVKIPVGAKVSAEIGFPPIVQLAQGIKNAGAKWISCVNCAVSIAPPDIYNRGKPIWPYTDGNPFVGASGSWLRLVSYKDAAAIARWVPGLDISAAGGIVRPQHAVEVMMLGAGLVQLCTGVFEQGRNLIRSTNKFLKNFLAEQGYKNLNEIVGLGQQYIKYAEEVNTWGENVIAVVDESKCTGCGICADNLCIARYMENGKAQVHEENCIGCGCCMIGCPVGAISLKKTA